jgi:hypothetical protein
LSINNALHFFTGGNNRCHERKPSIIPIREIAVNGPYAKKLGWVSRFLTGGG